ncbi:MAG: prepilin-type N-terminal cleavage/methylation domain-containing protein [Planctomycetota bacterium]
MRRNTQSQYLQARIIVADAASVGVTHCRSLLTDAGSVRHEFGSTESSSSQHQTNSKHQKSNPKLPHRDRSSVARFGFFRLVNRDSFGVGNLSFGTSSSCRRLPGRRGFSLLEVMLSLTLAIVLLGAVYSAMNQSWRLTASGREEMRMSQVARALVWNITLDVRAVMFVPPPPGTGETDASGGTGTTGTGTTGTGTTGTGTTGTGTTGSTSTTTTTDTTTEAEPSPKSIGIRGTMTQMELHISRARRDLDFSTNVDGNTIETRTSDLLAVTYSLALPGSGSTTGTGLIRTEGDRLIVQSVEEQGGLATQASRSEALAPEVAAIAFRYFDGTAWYEEWDSEVSGYLPRAIEVIIGFSPPTSSGGPLNNVVVSSSANQFRTLIIVPVADPLPPELAP